MSEVSKRCAVFLDRDGVINFKAPEDDYIRNWEGFRFIPGVEHWIRMFNSLGLLVIVVTNQRGIARGLVGRGDVEDIHARMVAELARRGARIDDIFCCPHNNGECECRKPAPGLIHQAREKWNLDLEKSIVIGDSDSDARLAAGCGMAFFLVQEGRFVG
jgi:histidinol-phosphate phosphatase family protein